MVDLIILVMGFSATLVCFGVAWWLWARDPIWAWTEEHAHIDTRSEPPAHADIPPDDPPAPSPVAPNTDATQMLDTAHFALYQRDENAPVPTREQPTQPIPQAVQYPPASRS